VSNKKRLKVTPKNADHDEFSVRRESYMQSFNQSINQSIKKAAYQKTSSLVIINDHNPPTMIHLSQAHDWSNHTDGHCSQRKRRQMMMMMMMMMIVAKDTEMGPHACKKCSDRSSSCLRRVMIRRIVHACKEECSGK
jgi:hypothetical protein